MQLVFTQENVFDEFVRASEGVPRDGINILSQAAQKAEGRKISINDIRRAAKEWYAIGKEKDIQHRPEAHRLLRYIIDEVIAHRRARAFMLESDIREDLINFLYDSRILHILKTSVSAHDQPGKRYTVYTIDYGCYVDLINTSKAPQGLFQLEHDQEYIEVPADDYRSIRRAILDLNSMLIQSPTL